jgi:ELWxxDGT repeat protein
MSIIRRNARRRRVESRRIRPLLNRSPEALEARALLTGIATPTTAALIQDINLADTQPRNLVDADGTMFFTVADSGSSSGMSLYKSDGTVAGTALVEDFPYDSVSNLTAIGSNVYFTTGGELWKSDGTPAGTGIVKDIAPGALRALPANLTAVGSTLYFTAFSHAATSSELWKSDGTEAGTVLVKTLAVDGIPYSPSVGNFTAVGSSLYFTTDQTTSLWKSDGTESGTVRIDAADLNGNDFVLSPTAVGDRLYFILADKSTYAERLWVTDGTDTGTTLVQDFSGDGGGYSSGLLKLTAVGSTLFFAGSDSTHGIELWKSDGTAAGTTIVADLGPGMGSADPSYLTAVGSTLFFSGTDSNGAKHLYKSDGTPDGTTAVHDLNYNANQNFDLPFAKHFAAQGGFLYFGYDDPATGPELYRTDGTTTTLVKDVLPGVDGSMPQDPTAGGGLVYFIGHGVPGSNQLLRTDGTADGTFAVASFTPARTADSMRYQVLTVGNAPVGLDGKSIFLADDGVHGTELWATDGTAAGTFMLRDINPGGDIVPSSPILLGDVLYFGVGVGLDGSGLNASLAGLWRTDGTTAGTTMVKSFAGGISAGYNKGVTNLTVFDGELFFVADDGTNGGALWKSDGTEDGTVLVKDVNPSTLNASGPMQLTVAGSTLYFSGNDGANGVSLWKSDGTAEGTSLVKVINPVKRMDFLYSGLHDLTAVGSNLFFSGSDGADGSALWRSDGTAEGTVIVKELTPAGNGQYDFLGGPSSLTAVGSNLYFVFDDGIHGKELWSSDGTADGTVMLKDINPGSGSSAPAHLTAFGSKLIFTADDGIHGQEFWASDGTPAGTVMLKDVNPGASEGFIDPGTGYPLFTSYNGSLYFAGIIYDLYGSHTDIYRTDGTPEGTVPLGVSAVTPGNGFGNRIIGALPSGLIVSVNDPNAGREPYLIIPGVSTNHAPTIDPVANQTVAIDQTLTIQANATDQDSDQTLTYSVTTTYPYNGNATIDPMTGLLSFTPTTSGTYQFAIVATDNGDPNYYDSTTFQVVVTNHAPTIEPVADQSTAVNRALTIPVTASDPDAGQTLTYSLGDGAPAGASIDPATGVVTYKPMKAGTYQIVVVATDDGSPALNAATTINVHAYGVVPQDFNGDGVSDYAVYRQSNGLWIVRQPGGNLLVTAMGDPSAGDTAAPGDYDGDGTTDFAVYRPSAALWIVRQSTGDTTFRYFGDPSQGDVAAPGDYDGDGKTEFAVYRPGAGLWIVQQPDGSIIVTAMGDPSQGDIAAPGDFDGDGKTDLAVYRPGTGLWIVRGTKAGTYITYFGDPSQDDIPAPADFDGDGVTDFTVFRPGSALWISNKSSGGALVTAMGDPAGHDIASNTSPFFQRKTKAGVSVSAFGSSSARASFDLSTPSAASSSPAVTVTTLSVPVPRPSQVTTAYKPASSLWIDGTNT